MTPGAGIRTRVIPMSWNDNSWGQNPEENPEEEANGNGWAPPGQTGGPEHRAPDSAPPGGEPAGFDATQQNPYEVNNTGLQTPEDLSSTGHYPQLDPNHNPYQNPGVTGVNPATGAQPQVDPYGTQQNPVVDPYGTQQNPQVNPPTGVNPAVDPYGTQQNPVVDPYGTQQNPQVDPYATSNYQTGADPSATGSQQPVNGNVGWNATGEVGATGYGQVDPATQQHQFGQPNYVADQTGAHTAVNPAVTQQQVGYGNTGTVPATQTQPGLDNYSPSQRQKSNGLPLPILIGAGVLVALAILLTLWFLVFSGDDEPDTNVESNSETPAETTVPPVTQAGPNNVTVSLVVAAPLCQAQNCTVTGPLNATEPAAYQIEVAGETVPAFTVSVDGTVLADPTAPFGFGGVPGRKQIQVMFEGSDELTTIDQYAFVPPTEGSYVVLSVVERTNDVADALVALESQQATFTDAILTEGSHFGDPQNLYIYANEVFADEAAGQAFCEANAIAADACNVQTLVSATDAPAEGGDAPVAEGEQDAEES